MDDVVGHIYHWKVHVCYAPHIYTYSALPLNGSHGLSTPKLSQFLHLAFVALYICSSSVLLDVYKF